MHNRVGPNLWCSLVRAPIFRVYIGRAITPLGIAVNAGAPIGTAGYARASFVTYRLMRVLLAASVAALLAACASEPSARTVAATTGDNRDDVICTREYPTGSNLPLTKCRTRELVDAEKDLATEALRRTTTGGSGAKMERP